MSSPHSRFYQQLSVVILAAGFGLCSSLSLAQGSTAIRLETIDFGGNGVLRQQSTQKQTGIWEHDTDRHRHGAKYHDGIKGHRSFGLSPSRDGQRHSHHHDIKQRARQYLPSDAHRHHFRHGHHSRIYWHLTSLDYSYAIVPSLRLSDLTTYQQQPYHSSTGADERRIDAWAALGNYQINTALQGFEQQIRLQPHSAFPRIGYALSIALSGDTENGTFAMQQALLSDLTDLHYFRLDVEQQLIVEELLLSYEEDSLMSAVLHYLIQDYTAAKRSLMEAKQQCHDCTIENKLAALIDRRR